MVGYGESLERARRPGWDAAYLDYASLKSLLEEVERLHAIVATAADSSSSTAGITNEGFPTSSTSLLADGDGGKESEMVALLGSPQRRGHRRDASVLSINQNEEEDSVLDEEARYHESTDLKTPLSKLDSSRKNLQLKAYEATEVFLSSLRKEVEKVSLFALSRQGELADAVGALRFNPHLDGSRGDNLSKPLNFIIRHDSKGNMDGGGGGGGGEYGSVHSDATPHSMTSTELDDDQMADELWFLLPSMTLGNRKIGTAAKEGTVTNSSLLFRESLETTAPRPLFAGDAVLRTKSNNNAKGHFEADDEDTTNQTQSLDPFTFIGVELLHLLRFICVNAMVRQRH
jgi:SPX domain.